MQALKLAIAALKAEKQRLAFDANMHDLRGAEYPQAVAASKKRKRIVQAIETLAEIIAEESS